DLYIYQPRFPNLGAAGSAISRFDGQTLAFKSFFVSQDTRLVNNETQKPRFGPDPDNGDLYDLYVPTDFGTVVRYDGTTGAFIDSFAPPTSLAVAPTNIGFAPDGSLYVTYCQGNEGNQGNVLHYDKTGALLGEVPAPPNDPFLPSWFQPRAVTFSTTVADA